MQKTASIATASAIIHGWEILRAAGPDRGPCAGAGWGLLCAAAGCVLLAVAARRRGGSTGVAAAAPAVGGVLLAVAVRTAALYAVRPACAGMPMVAALAVEIAAGAAVYLPAALAMRRLTRKVTPGA